MAQPFNILRSHCSLLTDPALREQVQAHTSDDGQTDSILRSIGRFGDDLSIRSFEMTPVARRSSYHRTSASASWTVRAVR